MDQNPDWTASDVRRGLCVDGQETIRELWSSHNSVQSRFVAGLGSPAKVLTLRGFSE